ncbi:unnamed protein product [Protopolystoma xenopodis]|uniref:Uncharacterized protein n=1 Tax=Protopolystoma xenopodis TaxID=117903 RepID=A0A448XQ45_9PLAT|nr:unnamed protein product [Protopolystoma xenopodis]
MYHVHGPTLEMMMHTMDSGLGYPSSEAGGRGHKSIGQAPSGFSLPIFHIIELICLPCIPSHLRTSDTISIRPNHQLADCLNRLQDSLDELQVTESRVADHEDWLRCLEASLQKRLAAHLVAEDCDAREFAEWRDRLARVRQFEGNVGQMADMKLAEGRDEEAEKLSQFRNRIEVRYRALNVGF